MYTSQKVLLGVSDSVLTSPAQCIADYRDLSLSIVTSTASASNITVQMCNVDGFTAAIPEGMWSTVTVIGACGMQTIDPGARWMRVVRGDIAVSAVSNTTVELQGKALQ